MFWGLQRSFSATHTLQIQRLISIILWLILFSISIFPLTPFSPTAGLLPLLLTSSESLPLSLPMLVVCGLQGAVGIVGGYLGPPWSPATHLPFCHLNTAYARNNPQIYS